jgi:amino acid efflux transporter
MVAIYFVGMLAATLLLRRWSVGWWLAVVATALTAGLLVLAGTNLVVPAALAVAALAVTVVRRVRGRRRAHADDPDARAGDAGPGSKHRVEERV